MCQDFFIAGIGDEGQFDQDGWHARVREDIQSVDAGFGNLYATICRIQGIDDLALDAARQHTATVTARAGPGFCAVGFFGFSSIAVDGHEDVGITGIGGLTDFLQAVRLEQFCCYSCRIQVTFRRLTDARATSHSRRPLSLLTAPGSGWPPGA